MRNLGEARALDQPMASTSRRRATRAADAAPALSASTAAAARTGEVDVTAGLPEKDVVPTLAPSARTLPAAKLTTMRASAGAAAGRVSVDVSAAYEDAERPAREASSLNHKWPLFVDAPQERQAPRQNCSQPQQRGNALARCMHRRYCLRTICYRIGRDDGCLRR